MHILVVEDDSRQADTCITALKAGLPGITINLVKSGSEGVEAIEQYASDPPAFIIMDVVLPWNWGPKFPRIPMPMDYDLNEGGVYLLNLLKANSAYSDVPVMLWSAVHRHMRNRPVSGVVSKKDMKGDPLVDQIRSMLLAKGHKFDDKQSRVSSIAKQIDVKPSFFGISINAKQALAILLKKKEDR